MTLHPAQNTTTTMNISMLKDSVVVSSGEGNALRAWLHSCLMLSSQVCITGTNYSVECVTLCVDLYCEPRDDSLRTRTDSHFDEYNHRQ